MRLNWKRRVACGLALASLVVALPLAVYAAVELIGEYGVVAVGMIIAFILGFIFGE